MHQLCMYYICKCTLKTGIPIEEGDSILKLLRRVSRPRIQLGVGIHSDFTFQVRSKLLIITVVLYLFFFFFKFMYLGGWGGVFY